jgi:hypothetical protein
MGAYLEALHHTSFYYTFVGITQVVAAILLIIPRTLTLALLYFPIIVNIYLLSIALRFEGSIITSPLMVLANLYILIWNYDRLKYILPFQKFPYYGIIEKPKKYTNKFPFIFFTAEILTVGITVSLAQYAYDVMLRNSLADCKKTIYQH